MTQRTAVEKLAVLRAAITDSGKSVGAFAREVVIRDPRTVRKWLAGEREIPHAVLSWLDRSRPPGYREGSTWGGSE